MGLHKERKGMREGIHESTHKVLCSYLNSLFQIIAATKYSVITATGKLNNCHTMGEGRRTWEYSKMQQCYLKEDKD